MRRAGLKPIRTHGFRYFIPCVCKLTVSLRLIAGVFTHILLLLFVAHTLLFKTLTDTPKSSIPVESAFSLRRAARRCLHRVLSAILVNLFASSSERRTKHIKSPFMPFFPSLCVCA